MNQKKSQSFCMMIIPLLMIKKQAQRGSTACPQNFNLCDCIYDVPSTAVYSPYKILIPLFCSFHVLHYLPTMLRENSLSVTLVHQAK